MTTALASAVLVLFAMVSPVLADPVQTPHAYALLVGSNRPGPGQEKLRFAAADAKRLADVLVQVGGYSSSGVVQLIDPSAAQLRSALEELSRRLEEHRRRGEEAMAFFYYSGHARSQALNLGDEELPLTELKLKLEALPAKVKIAVLDACQSGALSGVKGVSPAADFSHNSVAGLNVEGLAVLASSAGSELSQESNELGGSYFSHHFSVGLRGAADENRDGAVSLTEVYRYAYNRTLVDTAATAVGRQHVTLETEMKGKGEMVLSRPGVGKSAIALPAQLQGELVVHRESDDTVMAEVHKAAGSTMRLAMPPEKYSAIVRQNGKAYRCELRVAPHATTELLLDRCARIRLENAHSKGALFSHVAAEKFSLEVFAGIAGARRDDYNETLETFGYESGAFSLPAHLQLDVSLVWQFVRHLSLVLTGSNLDAQEYGWPKLGENSWDISKEFSWKSARLSLQLRGSYAVRRWFILYGQIGVGPTIAWSNYNEVSNGIVGVDELTRDDTEVYWGYNLCAGAGLQFMPWRHFGFGVQLQYIFAPALENELGDTHDSGGFGGAVGLRGAY